jgi:hypothetical protein
MQQLSLSMRLHCDQPHSSPYLALSLVAGTASLYFFRNDALLFLSWYLLILTADLYERYGISYRTMAGSSEEGASFSTASAAASSSAPSDPAPALVLLPLELSPWPTRTKDDVATTKTWQSFEAPPELYEIPQDERVPEELLNIIRWSLVQGNAREYNTDASELPADDFSHLASMITTDQESHDQELQTESPYEEPQAKPRNQDLQTESSPQPSFKEPVEAEECNPPKDIQSKNKDGKREKLRHFLGIRGSIADLSSEVRESLARARSVKAAREAKERESNRTVECTGCFVSPHILKHWRTPESWTDHLL